MTKLIISSDLSTNSSGHIVVSKELEAMRKLDNDIIQIGHNDISPIANGLPDTPFLQDYLTLECLSKIDLSKIDLCHMYSTPFPQTIRYLKSKNIKTSITCAAHNRQDTIKEFELLGYTYPFNHIKDDNLWKIYSGDIREADIVITPSKSSEKFLKSEGAKRIEIIPHGCDIPDENKIESISQNQFNIGYMGAVGPDKGLKYLIQAWSSLNYQDSILIFGGAYSKELEPFINKYSTGGKFHLIGYIPHIYDFYNNISLYVQSSVTEGWGIEVIEAMSYGRPVICSEGAGASCAIENGINGYIVPKRDPKTIAKKIDYLKNNPKILLQMGQNARTISLNYDWKLIRQKYINLWEKLL